MTVRSRAICLSSAVALTGCMASLPPAPQRDPTIVQSAFVPTWNAVIDVFAASNMPIATMDRASGFIATQPLRVGTEGLGWATCMSALGIQLTPETATFNVVVREAAEDRSTVRVTVAYANDNGTCVTRGTYESDFERKVKDHAERNAAHVSSTEAVAGIEPGTWVLVRGNGARIRDTPEPSGSIIVLLPAGDRIQVVDLTNVAWARVDMRNGRSGYIHVSELLPDRSREH